MRKEPCIVALTGLSVDSTEPKTACRNGHEYTLELKKGVTQMSDKENRLLKVCMAVVVCFLLSYLPLALLTIWLPTRSEKIPSWAVDLNAFCGSLWNPFLYFLNQFF